MVEDPLLEHSPYGNTDKMIILFIWFFSNSLDRFLYVVLHPLD